MEVEKRKLCPVSQESTGITTFLNGGFEWQRWGQRRLSCRRSHHCSAVRSQTVSRGYAALEQLSQCYPKWLRRSSWQFKVCTLFFSFWISTSLNSLFLKVLCGLECDFFLCSQQSEGQHWGNSQKQFMIRELRPQAEGPVGNGSTNILCV